MAYVRKTDDIWRHIESKIGSMFAERITHAENWYSYGLSQAEMEQIIMDNVLSAREQQLIDELGERFFKPAGSLTVNIVVPDASAAQYKVEFNGNKRLLPAQWDSYYDNDRQKVTDPRVVDVATRRRAKVQAVTSERAAMITQVKEIWGKVPSVNRLVKVWPPGRDLLDTDTLRKLNEKTEREAAEAVVVDDAALSKLNTNLLRARVAA